MPTGYTEVILNGATFEEFVWTAARAMGAFIHQRDEGPNAMPVLYEKPSDYYLKQLANAKEELSRLERRSPEEWQSEYDAAQREHADFVERLKSANSEKRAKYDAVLEKVKAWTPPTPDHENFKSFMVKQIEESIGYDCSEPFQRCPLRPFEEWKADRLRNAQWYVEHYRKEQEEEVARVAARNKWKADLLASVPLPATR